MHRGSSYRVGRAVARPLVRLFTRRLRSGTQHVPGEGGVVLAANHLSFLDPVVLGVVVDDLGREPRFLAKAELFGVPVLGRVMRGAGQIPVARGTSDARLAADAAVAALSRGECVVVYPEGTLTHDPRLWPMRGRRGVARMALSTGAPVVPVAHWGVHEILPPWSRRLRLLPRRTVRVAFGPPVDLSDLAGWGPDTANGRGTASPPAAVLDEATDRIMAAITAQLATLRGESAPPNLFDPGTMTGSGPARTAPRDER